MKIQILNWQQHFENSKSRERDRCSFCCIPNKIGMGLSQMLSEPDGAALYGIFCLILGLLSRQTKPRDGYLTDTGRADGRYLTGTELALLWRRPIAEIEQTMAFICQSNIGWAIDLEQNCPPSARELPAECPPSALEGRKEGRNMRARPGVAVELPPPPPPNLPTTALQLFDAIADIWPGEVQIRGNDGIEQLARSFAEIGATPTTLKAAYAKARAEWTSPGGPEAIIKHFGSLVPRPKPTNGHAKKELTQDHVNTLLDADLAKKRASMVRNRVFEDAPIPAPTQNPEK